MDSFTVKSLLFFTAMVLAAPDPLITHKPLLKRQNLEQRLIGYYENSGTYEAYACDAPYTWSSWSTFGGCYSTGVTSPAFITQCSGAYMYYSTLGGTSSSRSCTISCNTDKVMQTINDPNPVLWIGCDTDGKQTNYYRKNPASTTSFTPASPTSNMPPPTTTTPAPTPTPTPPPQSKAWIAGVVIGPLAFIAIVGLVVWIFLLKKKNNRLSAQHDPGAPSVESYPPPTYASKTHMTQSVHSDPRFSGHTKYSSPPVSPSPTWISGGEWPQNSPKFPQGEGSTSNFEGGGITVQNNHQAAPLSEHPPNSVNFTPQQPERPVWQNVESQPRQAEGVNVIQTYTIPTQLQPTNTTAMEIRPSNTSPVQIPQANTIPIQLQPTKNPQRSGPDGRVVEIG